MTPRQVLQSAAQAIEQADALLHGCRSTYQGGCRCTPCRAANAQYMATLRTRQAHGQAPLGTLVNAKEAGAHVRAILIERYSKRELLKQTGLERHTLPRLNATTRCRLKTVLRLRRAYRILVAVPDGLDAQA